MCQNLYIFGRKLVVIIAAVVYSLHYWINFNIWITTDSFNILDYIYIIATNITFIMLLWCFIVMLITDPGRPKKADEHTFQPFTKKGFCQNCKSPKPERCHHCSVCDRCVLQMDHHCPWINTCVGYQNRKQFILLLCYALFFNFETILGTTKTYLLQFNLTFLNLLYAFLCIGNYVLVFLLSQFLKYHIELLLKNQTTLEDIIYKAHSITFNVYDIDRTTNIQQIFGSNKLLWFFPIYSGEGCEDGNQFPLKNDFKLKQAPPPQVTQILYEQHVVNSDKRLEEHPKIETLYRREKEKKQINDILKD